MRQKEWVDAGVTYSLIKSVADIWSKLRLIPLSSDWQLTYKVL